MGWTRYMKRDWKDQTCEMEQHKCTSEEVQEVYCDRFKDIWITIAASGTWMVSLLLLLQYYVFKFKDEKWTSHIILLFNVEGCKKLKQCFAEIFRYCIHFPPIHLYKLCVKKIEKKYTCPTAVLLSYYCISEFYSSTMCIY